VPLTFVTSRTADLPKEAAEPAGTSVEVPLPSAGLYLIEVRRGTRAAVVSAVSSGLALVVKRDSAGILAFAADRVSGGAIEGATVEVRAGERVLATGRTDAKGLLRLDVAAPPTIEVRARRGDDLAFGVETYVPADVSDRRVYAFPHQPAYRPGERVEVKGIVRAWRDGHHVLDESAREAKVAFLAEGGRELGERRRAHLGRPRHRSRRLDLPRTARSATGRSWWTWAGRPTRPRSASRPTASPRSR
jgi:hypothetical protein